MSTLHNLSYRARTHLADAQESIDDAHFLLADDASPDSLRALRAAARLIELVRGCGGITARHSTALREAVHELLR